MSDFVEVLSSVYAFLAIGFSMVLVFKKFGVLRHSGYWSSGETVDAAGFQRRTRTFNVTGGPIAIVVQTLFFFFLYKMVGEPILRQSPALAILAWLGSVALGYYLGQRRGVSQILGAFTGLALGPLGVLILYALPDPTSAEPGAGAGEPGTVPLSRSAKRTYFDP